MEILAAKDLSFTYPKSPRKALDSVSFSVDEGDFVCLCGTTGSGKSTLLRLFKPELYQNADISGDIYFCGRRLSECSPDERMSIGYVMQSPNEQIVCDKVIHELCFGMENLAYPQSKMELRLAEISAFFGLGDILDKNVADLSGGQKQLLNLASVMVMQPKILILDDSSSALDFATDAKLRKALNELKKSEKLTSVTVSQRATSIKYSDLIIVMDDGKMVGKGKHADLIRDCQLYRDIALSQMSPEELGL